MKKIIFCFSLLIFVFFGCKTTQIVPKNTEEIIEQTFVDDTSVENAIEDNFTDFTEENNENEEFSEILSSDDIFIDTSSFDDEIIEEINEEEIFENETFLDEKNLESEILENAEENLQGESENLESIDENNIEQDFLQENIDEISEEVLENIEENFTENEEVLTEENNEEIAGNFIEENEEISEILENPIETETEEISIDEGENLNLEIIEKKPSREVNAKRGQTLVIDYPGTGWIYLGEVNNNSTVRFLSKNNLSGKVQFKLLVTKEGETLLHFYKVDNLSSTYIDDYLSVKVSGFDNKNTEVFAPVYKYDSYLLEQNISQEDEMLKNFENTEIEEIEESPIITENIDSDIVFEEPEVVFMDDFFIEEENSVLENDENSNFLTEDYSSNENLLEDAFNFYNQKQFSKALELVNFYINNFNFELDKAYFLKGQILEEKFEKRNIKEALFCYSFVVENYPLSDYWNSSNERAIYLQRFYFNIR